MKINFILPAYPWVPIGGYKVIYEYANRLSERGHEVFIIYSRKLKNSFARRSFYEKMRDSRNYFFKPNINWHHIFPKVKQLFVPEIIPGFIPNADVVFATSWETAEYVYDYPQEKGNKFYFIQSYEIWSGPEERIKKTWLFPFRKVVISQWLYSIGLKLDIKEEGMIYLPNAIDHNVFCLRNPVSERQLSISMLFSKLRMKGSEDGINALGILKKEFPDLNASIFGVSRMSGLPPWIKYYRQPSQYLLVNEIYNQSAIHLCTSWSEGWYLPSFEAMACGCAVVSTDIGGVKDYAEHNKTALLSPVKNPQKLAENASLLLKDDQLRYSIAKAGYEKSFKFDWGNNTVKLEKFISGENQRCLD